MSSALTGSVLRSLRTALLRWFDGHRRDLPWRATRDPWAILVSEVMLQQTTVSTVLPYWQRFLERFPAPDDLARASVDEVLEHWSGLGYYGRARRLQAAARELALAPRRDAAGLRELPGVGAYTAAAVASIAFGEAVAAVDGNVQRVLSRLCAVPGDPTRAAVRKALQQLAQELLDPDRPGDANQALMELGAMLCRPREPRCKACPLAAHCLAHERGEEQRFPELEARPAPTAVVRAAALVQRGHRLLVCLREAPPNEGFVELPSIDIPRPAAAPDALRRLFAERFGLQLRIGEALPVHRHVITRYRIQVHPFIATLSSGRVVAPLSWTDGRPAHPFTTATRRILAKSVPRLLSAATPA